MTQTRQLADDAAKAGPFDCVIHNAGIHQGGFRKTNEGLPSLIAVNVLAPYILTCLMPRPKRLVLLSSDSHYSGDGSVNNLTWQERGEIKRSDTRTYSDLKLYNNLLANAFARRWTDVQSSSFHPGWMPTKTGGKMAPGDFKASVETYVMLAEGNGMGETSGRYFDPGRKEGKPNPAANGENAQNRSMKACEEVTGVKAPS